MKLAKNRNVLLVSLSFFFIFFGFGAAQQFVIPTFAESGGEQIALTSLIILYVTFAAATIFSPRIISAIGSKKSFIFSNAIYAAFILAIFIRNEGLLYAFSFLEGIAGAMLFVNAGSYIINMTDKRQRGEALGFQTSLFVLGNLLGIVSTTILLGIFDAQNIFLILSGISALGVIPFFLIKDAKIRIGGRSFWDVLRNFRNSRIILLSPMVIVTFFLFASTFSSINIIVGNNSNIFYSGMVGVVFFSIFFASSYLLGVLTKSVSREKILFVALSLCLIGLTLVLTQSDLALLFAGVVMVSIFVASGFPVSLNLMKDMSKRDPETATGTFNLLNSLGVLISLVSVTIFSQYFSVGLALSIGILSLAFLIILSRKK